MNYQLLIGDKAYSSWSLRPWLLFRKFHIPVDVHTTEFYKPQFEEDLTAWAPTRTVPAVRTPEGGLWSDSLAIAEGLAEAHPDKDLYPKAPKTRALARSMTCEMHSSFNALRGSCPMNLRGKWEGFTPSDAVLTDIARIELLWSLARGTIEGADEGWLFGQYTIADAFFAPVAARLAGYGLPISQEAQAYVDRVLNDPDLRQWRAMGEAHNRTLLNYDQGLPFTAWPYTPSVTGVALDVLPDKQRLVNETCPYSGDPVTDFMELSGKIYGFCNAFCRDKTAQDPEVWPAFMAINHS